jgi:hypothetical protein
MKIISRELPLYGLKMVAIPPNEIAGYAYLCGALRLDSAIEFPIDAMTTGMPELYRGSKIMYSDTNEEGSNASWEAEACGLPVVHHKNSPQEIADAIMAEPPKPVRRDIKETAKVLVAVLSSQFE